MGSVLLVAALSVPISLYLRRNRIPGGELVVKCILSFGAWMFIAVSMYGMILPAVKVLDGEYGPSAIISEVWNEEPLFVLAGTIVAYALHIPSRRRCLAAACDHPADDKTCHPKNAPQSPILALLEIPLAVHSLILGLSCDFSYTGFLSAIAAFLLYHILLSASLAIICSRGSALHSLAPALCGAMASIGIILRYLSAEYSPMWSVERLAIAAFVEGFFGGILTYECISGLLPNCIPDNPYKGSIFANVLASLSGLLGSGALVLICS